MDLGIAGKTALVTASSKGLGRAAADALADEGANLVICARGEEALEHAENELRSRGANVLAIRADVTHRETPARLVSDAFAEFGALDILVANAGGPPAGHALEVDDEAFAAAFDANFLTSVRLVREALPHMQEHNWGRICLITSISVKQPIPYLTLSNTSRTALWSWAKTAAHDIRDSGVTLNLACPAYHLTERMVQLGGAPQNAEAGEPTDFGKVVAFLCSQPAGFITGSAVSVDGGSTVGLL